MNQLHVGRGASRGALTVFPIWAEDSYPVSYSTDPSLARIGERPGHPEVGELTVTNTGTVPLLLLEGELLEGGLQHRMVARSSLLAGGGAFPLEVVCVEQGRWDGAGGHSARGRRASVRVRAGLRALDRQGEVWRRVGGYEARIGANPTGSYLEHALRADALVRELVRGLRPFPGQVGVLIGLAGQPITAETFDTPRTLSRQFDAIVAAAAIDALGLPPIATPARRARRFLDRADLVQRHVSGPGGIADRFEGRTEYVDLAGLAWDGHDVHTLLTNPRHEFVLAA